jgi:uncharacterized membrane protein YtjA (UPF0391 family)
MLKYTPAFLFSSLIPGFFGFGGIAGEATDIAQILFYVFLAIFIITVFRERQMMYQLKSAKITLHREDR